MIAALTKKLDVKLAWFTPLRALAIRVVLTWIVLVVVNVDDNHTVHALLFALLMVLWLEYGSQENSRANHLQMKCAASDRALVHAAQELQQLDMLRDMFTRTAAGNAQLNVIDVTHKNGELSVNIRSYSEDTGFFLQLRERLTAADALAAQRQAAAKVNLQ